MINDGVVSGNVTQSTGVLGQAVTLGGPGTLPSVDQVVRVLLGQASPA